LHPTWISYLLIVCKWFGSDPGDMSGVSKKDRKLKFPIKEKQKKEPEVDGCNIITFSIQGSFSDI
jgi:hypothetical protein